jgi:hypothetical protein
MKKFLFAILLTYCPLKCYPCEKTSPINELEFQLVYVNIFDSEIYDSYFQQMHSFVQQELQGSPNLADAIHSPKHDATAFERKGLKFLEELLSYNLQDPYSKALFHSDKIKQLRNLIKHKKKWEVDGTPIQRKIAEFIDNLTVWLYTRPDLSNSIKKFMYQEVGLDENLVFYTFKKEPQSFFNNIHTILANLARFSDREKQERILNDPNLYGDMPSVLFELSNKKTTMIRTPSIVRDLKIDEVNGKTIAAALNEEFLNYLKASRGKLHFYVNLLDREKKDLIKSSLIENLESDPEVGPSIAVITLDKQKAADFYFQKGEFQDLSNANQFKSAFFSKLFDPDGLYYWSNKLEPIEWKNQVLEILEEIHQQFFSGREELMIEERLDFIEITYLKIIEAIVEKIHPDVMNITCKQSVDRGPSVYMLYYLYDRLKTGRPVEFEIQNMYWLLFSAPLAFHNRPGHDYRISRFQTAANRMIQSLSNPLAY